MSYMIVLKDKAERIRSVRLTVVVVEIEDTSICRRTIVTATTEPRIVSVNEIGVLKQPLIFNYILLYII